MEALRYSFVFLLLVLFGLTVNAQPNVDLRFLPVEGEGDNAENYCINVQVQGSDGADYIGISSIRISYDFDVLLFSGSSSSPSGITTGDYQEINFNANDGSDPDFPLDFTCTEDGGGFGASPYSEHSFDGLFPGDILLTLALQSPSIDIPGGPLVFACPNIDVDWVNVAQICFEVLDGSGDPNLQFVGAMGDPAGDETGTNFNTSFNDPNDKYWNGDFEPFNISYNDFLGVIDGCTDADACNYNPDAVEDDGSCLYFDCEGNCGGAAVEGAFCEEDGDPNTQGLWTGDCECSEVLIQQGCTDPCALNYDPDAIEDDGSCEFPDCDDGCELTIDTFDADNCECINEDPDPDDGCELTTDSFDADNCEIINEVPDVDDTCDLTEDTFDAANCLIINTPPICDDGLCSTADTFDPVNCECVFNSDFDCDDGCELTADSYDEDLCECVNELPDVDDGCELTEDSFDANNCLILNTPPDVDDGCALTTDSFDAASCLILNTPPIIDDGCDLTIDTFDLVNCLILSTPPDVDDGCDLTIDSFDAANCLIVNEAPDVDDGCALTVDGFDAIACEIVNIEPDCNDGDSLTADYFDLLLCECFNDLMAIEGCTNPCATNYNPLATVEDESCEFPFCDDACDLTTDFFDEVSCECINELPLVDDGCDLTIDSFDAANCQIINETPDVSDNCDLTVDSFDANNCIIINTPPDCNDDDPTTADAFDFDLCECINGLIILEGCTNPCALNYDPLATVNDESCEFPDCDDNCFLTTDFYDDINCECINEEPDVDDNCPLTIDSFDSVNCVIIHNPAACDDGDSLTIDTFDPTFCECSFELIGAGCTNECALNYDPTATSDDGSCQFPDPDDGCNLTTDVYDAVNCVITNIEPSPDDGCDLTTDVFDAANCLITNTPPNIDDGCDLTTDVFDAANCIIINTPPNCDDNDSSTTDSFNLGSCECVNEFIGGNCTDPCALNYNPNATIDDGSCEYPDPDDGCPLTVDAYDLVNCVVVNTPPNVDDGCALTIDSFDFVNCVIINEAPNPDDGCDLTTEFFDAENCLIFNVPPDCDDGDILTTDFFDADNCECINEVMPIDGCTDQCAPNYNPTATVDDGSCDEYDTACDTDICTNGGTYMWNPISCECVFDQATVTGCTDATACNYDPEANCDDNSCILTLEGCNCEDVPGCTNPDSENYEASATCDDGSCFMLGLSDIEQDYPVSIYPNPSNSDLNLDFGNQAPQSVRFFNLDGKVVYQANQITNTKMQLNVSNWAQGIYLIAVQYEEGLVWEKVVVN